MTQRNFVLQFFDELRVLIGRSFAEASGSGFWPGLCKWHSTDEKRPVLRGRRIRELSSV